MNKNLNLRWIQVKKPFCFYHFKPLIIIEAESIVYFIPHIPVRMTQGIPGPTDLVFYMNSSKMDLLKLLGLSFDQVSRLACQALKYGRNVLNQQVLTAA